jgi:GNAT superfamily N-acetyltransferase
VAAFCFVGEIQEKPVVFSAITNTGFYIDWVVRGAGSFHSDKGKKILANNAIENRRSLGIPDSWSLLQLMREHRTVVLPDYQGFGLGSLMADAVAHLCSEMGYTFMSTTAHPTYGGYRDRSPFWKALTSSQRERTGARATTFSHVWIGAIKVDGSIDKSRAELLRKRVVIDAPIAGVVPES